MTSAALLVLPSVLLVLRAEAYRAWRSLERFGFKANDLHQEFALHLLETHRSYDPRRASLATFSARLCRNRTLQLLEGASCAKRGGGVVPRSLSDRVVIGDRADNADVTELVDTISEDAVARRMGRRSRSAAELIALRLDVDRVVRELPVELAELATLLAAGEPISTAAHRLKISRSTAYRRLSELRHAFHRARLDGYLVKGAA
jgi:hypothetical protein